MAELRKTVSPGTVQGSRTGLASAAVPFGGHVLNLSRMDKVIGMLDYVDYCSGGHAGSLRPDGSIEAELQIITGATNEMGFNCMSAR